MGNFTRQNIGGIGTVAPIIFLNWFLLIIRTTVSQICKHLNFPTISPRPASRWTPDSGHTTRNPLEQIYHTVNRLRSFLSVIWSFKSFGSFRPLGPFWSLGHHYQHCHWPTHTHMNNIRLGLPGLLRRQISPATDSFYLLFKVDDNIIFN